MKQYPNAASGLRILFIAQLLSIAGSLLIWIPLVGPGLIIVAAVAELAGIYKAGADDENYRGALVFAAAVLAVSVISGILGEGTVSSILDVVTEILSLLMVYSVCNTTANLLHSIGSEAIAQRGGTVIKIYAACTAVSILCRVLSLIPIIKLAAGLASLAAAVVQVAGYVMFLLFLNDSSKAL